MKSIRLKFMLFLSLFILAIIALVIFLNTEFLDEYFIAINKDRMRQAAQDILQSGDPGKAINDVQDQLGMLGVMFDENLQPIKTPQTRMDSQELQQIQSIIQSFSAGKRPQYFTVTRNQPTVRMIYAVRLHNGDILTLIKSANAIFESSQIANNFIQIVGAGCIVLALIAAAIFSRSITRPIVQLDHMAKKIAHQEFDDRFESHRQDEIHTLGQSMNAISTQLSEAIEQLKTDIQKKEQVDAMRKEFVANVSHEIKSPVGLITGYSEMLQRRERHLDPKSQQYIEIIHGEALRINDISAKLLLLAGLESGTHTLKQNPVNLSDLTLDVLRRNEVHLADIQLDKQIEEDVVISGDETLLEMAISNLIVNAMKYTIDKKIIISVNPHRIRVSNATNSLIADDLESLWEHFYRVDKARSRKGHSTGLGLSIVKTIAHLHALECKASLESTTDQEMVHFDLIIT